MLMAEQRAGGIQITLRGEPRLRHLVRVDEMRDLLMWPAEAQERRLRKSFPELDDAGVAEMRAEIDRLKEEDPLTALQDNIFGGGEEGGQMRLMQMVPNFEMAMYIAQATGASIVTDSAYRWQEITRAARPRANAPPARLRELAAEIADAEFLFPYDSDRVVRLARERTLDVYPRLFGDVFHYLANVAERGTKPNFEKGLLAKFAKSHAAAQRTLGKRGEASNEARISCVFAPTGIQDNTINRLLLMSSSEHHLPMVPAAFYIQRLDT